MSEIIKVKVNVEAEMEEVWEYWTDPSRSSWSIENATNGLAKYFK